MQVCVIRKFLNYVFVIIEKMASNSTNLSLKTQRKEKEKEQESVKSVVIV